MRPLILLLFSLPAAAADRTHVLEIWTRDPNPDGKQERRVTIDLDAAKTIESELADAQLDGARRTYRHLAVAALIEQYGAPPETDVALIHFANGMMIPLPFRDRAVLERLSPVIARAVKLDSGWTTDLPPLRRHDQTYFDVRPIRFQGSKLVVREGWHPDLTPGSEASFSPWRHADTPVGIELVDGAAFLAQFDVDPAARDGFSHFRRVCRFCHGARRVGSQFGWDFVEPLPIVEYRRKDKSLYYHLRYRSSNAPVRGLMMPSLPFIDEKDATAVHGWLRALAQKPLRPYLPARPPHAAH